MNKNDKKTHTNQKRDSNFNKKKHTKFTAGKFLSILGAVFCGFLIPLISVNFILLIESVVTPNKVPGLLGVFPMIVVTDSMSPEIEAGDMIITGKISTEEIKAGDIIAFFDPMVTDGQKITTHRVVGVNVNESGIRSYVTKGDNNNINDNFSVTEDRVIGTYRWKIKGVGKVTLYMRTLPGFIICVLMPLLLLTIYDLLRQRLYEKRNKTETVRLRREIEKLRAGKN